MDDAITAVEDQMNAAGAGDISETLSVFAKKLMVKFTDSRT
ncbi:MAG: hypothetical protein ACLUL2_10170 [Blautia sp.]